MNKKVLKWVLGIACVYGVAEIFYQCGKACMLGYLKRYKLNAEDAENAIRDTDTIRGKLILFACNATEEGLKNGYLHKI